MRIIAGKHRSRAILGPKDAAVTRPITDRVKESLFNRLHSLGVLGYGRVADVFCGTGSLGLEALSRGAEHVTFVDQDREGIMRLRENLDTLDESANAAVIQASALTPIWSAGMMDGSLALAFFDPPYAMAADETMRPALDQTIVALYPKLEPGGVVVLRTDRRTAADELDGFDGPVTFHYGSMSLHFYQRPLPEQDTEDRPDVAQPAGPDLPV